VSKPFLTPINLVQAATDPVTATAGDMYFNTVDQAVKVYNGTSWNDVGTGTGGGNGNADAYTYMGVY